MPPARQTIELEGYFTERVLGIFKIIRNLILSARRQVAQAVNAGLTMLYWDIGRRIRQDLLEEKRAPYGEEIVSSLRRQLDWTPIEDMRLTLD